MRRPTALTLTIPAARLFSVGIASFCELRWSQRGLLFMKLSGGTSITETGRNITLEMLRSIRSVECEALLLICVSCVTTWIVVFMPPHNNDPRNHANEHQK